MMPKAKTDSLFACRHAERRVSGRFEADHQHVGMSKVDPLERRFADSVVEQRVDHDRSILQIAALYVFEVTHSDSKTRLPQPRVEQSFRDQLIKLVPVGMHRLSRGDEQGGAAATRPFPI